MTAFSNRRGRKKHLGSVLLYTQFLSPMAFVSAFKNSLMSKSNPVIVTPRERVFCSRILLCCGIGQLE